MTKDELLKILEPYPGDTVIWVPFHPGSVLVAANNVEKLITSGWNHGLNIVAITAEDKQKDIKHDFKDL